MVSRSFSLFTLSIFVAAITSANGDVGLGIGNLFKLNVGQQTSLKLGNIFSLDVGNGNVNVGLGGGSDGDDRLVDVSVGEDPDDAVIAADLDEAEVVDEVEEDPVEVVEDEEPQLERIEEIDGETEGEDGQVRVVVGDVVEVNVDEDGEEVVDINVGDLVTVQTRPSQDPETKPPPRTQRPAEIQEENLSNMV